MSLFRSLTARLVLTAVALVVLVAVLIGTAATLALHSRLTDQVDTQLNQARAGMRQVSPGCFGGGPNLQAGSLLAIVDTTDDSAIIRGNRFDECSQVSAQGIAQLNHLTPDAHIHEIDLDGAGSYRVIATSGTDVTTGATSTIVIGLPTDDVESAVHSLIVWEAALIALGALLAAGGGLLLVRRQLRPLTQVAATAHEVAELPLESGEIDLSARVPPELTDERTEVGQVGAALNALLAHVETSLEARQRSEQQVRQFVADASHELRTPLATIAGYTELARRRPDDVAVVRTAVAKVEEESARMTSLVEDLLLLARLDAGRPLQRESVDLTRLLIEAVDDARVVGPDHEWRLELPESPVEVTGDEQRLHQVVTNLLANARKHTPAGTTVTVVGHDDGFEVRDDGPGFPPGLVDHAFERFARGDVARERTGGAGLGLALVGAIVGSHGGGVGLTSGPGDTRVTVVLPVAAPGGSELASAGLSDNLG